MKFIFPQNYKFNSKILGIIDYETVVLNLIWSGVIYFIINLIFKNINIKIFLFILLAFPVLLFSIIGVEGEDFFDVIIYMTKFIIKPKLLFYNVLYEDKNKKMIKIVIKK